jgi:hypothetical protein
MIQFADSTTVSDIPPTFTHAALYHDGKFAASRADAARFTHVRWITIGTDYEHCGIVDYEPTNPVYEERKLAEYVRGRAEMGKIARVYCDRADVGRALADLAGCALPVPRLWWIATLDDERWTANLLAANIRQQFGSVIGAHLIWANQYQKAKPGQHYDVSRLFKDW